jgi:hypothetical protein
MTMEIRGLRNTPMPDRFHYLDEPYLVFGMDQRATDPRDGLALFGAVDAKVGLPNHIVLGTPRGLALWGSWSTALNEPAACIDVVRQRPWPPYPGFDVAFGTPWPAPTKAYTLDDQALNYAAHLSNQHERTYAVANLYVEQMKNVSRLDEKPALAVCVVPDAVYQNCRALRTVSNPTDQQVTNAERRHIRSILEDRDSGQMRMFSESDRYSVDDPTLEKFSLSPDFRRQLKARMMQHELPVQIVKESTLDISEEIRQGLPGSNPLSDRLWNFGTGVFYKLGRKPWRIDSARDGVCYIGLAYKRASSGKSACCAAQLFLDSGDGLVFVGEFGPWYSKEKEEFHLTEEAAKNLLKGALATYAAQGGRSLREVFLHARSGINCDEYAGFRQACPDSVNLVGIRVRKDRHGPRLFRHDTHPNISRRGMYPVLRGVFWQRTERQGLLFTSGFKERIAAYDGWEVPVPLSITLQHGKADLVGIARDILALSKVNYNTCQLGEGEPITVKYSDRVGEILLSNSELPREKWQHNFKYYI